MKVLNAVVFWSAVTMLLTMALFTKSADAQDTNSTNSSCLVLGSMTLSQLCHALKFFAYPYNNTQLIVNTTAYCATLSSMYLNKVRDTNLTTSLYFYFSTIASIGGVESKLLTTTLHTMRKAGYGDDDSMRQIHPGMQNSTVVTYAYCLGYQYLFDINAPSQLTFNSIFNNVNSTASSATVTVTTTAAAGK
jgi:hypothetical protein